jgi:single-strand DNA-binding protein
MVTKADGTKRQATDRHNVVAWGDLAESVGDYLSKGKYVYIAGRSSTRSYEDKEGNKKYITEVVAQMVALPLPSKKREEKQTPPSSQFDGYGHEVSEEEIPF